MPTAKSPSLAELQQWMRWVLTHPKGVGHALKQLGPADRRLQVIGETPEVDREKRLSIYGNGYFWRIIEVLGSTFSALKNVVGNDAFDGLARRYLIKYPSSFKSIDDIGHHMSAFIKTDPLSKKFPFLSDLAAVAWATHQAFFADDLPPLDLKVLKGIPPSKWPHARFEFDSSVRMLEVNWPVNDLWREDGKWTKQRLARLKKDRQWVLVFRLPEKFVRAPRITAVQYRLLTGLAEGKNLKQALSNITITSKNQRELTQLQDWFETWTRTGIIRPITPRPR